MWPWACDLDNLIKRKEREKAQKPIPHKINIEKKNWNKNNFIKGPKKTKINLCEPLKTMTQ
jgi:hypothetical protein